MKIPPSVRLVLLAAGCALLTGPAMAQTDPLASWNDGPAKQAIMKFVGDVTKYVVNKAACRVILTAPPAQDRRPDERPDETPAPTG